jgi:fatty acid desaturase
MPSDKDQKDIEIIPPERLRQNGEPEWVHITFGGSAKAFSDLPLHKRIMLVATWLAGAIVFALIIFLIVASAVLIWIPLLIAAILVTTLVVFFRAKFLRR